MNMVWRRVVVGVAAMAAVFLIAVVVGDAVRPTVVLIVMIAAAGLVVTLDVLRVRRRRGRAT